MVVLNRLEWLASQLHCGAAASVHISFNAKLMRSKISFKLADGDSGSFSPIATSMVHMVRQYELSPSARVWDGGHRHSTGVHHVTFWVAHAGGGHQRTAAGGDNNELPKVLAVSTEKSTELDNQQKVAEFQKVSSRRFQVSQSHTAEGSQSLQAPEGAGPEGLSSHSVEHQRKLVERIDALKQELTAAKAVMAEQLKVLAEQQKEHTVPADTGRDATTPAKDAEESPAIAADAPVTKSAQADPEATGITNTCTSRPWSSPCPTVEPQKELTEPQKELTEKDPTEPQKELTEPQMDQIKKFVLKTYSFTKQTASDMIAAELREMKEMKETSLQTTRYKGSCQATRSEYMTAMDEG
eukprot:TRINITY_DN7937_c1_g1_i7.p1 TRINITY_DN7937_c1_g1~~TRINITY_DN7937_c1_g1_i7.p1  ORF type:complete len:354 (+),score=72.61 TRINITY_DN7937_c1_g1_i7:140-1201(+)